MRVIPCIVRSLSRVPSMPSMDAGYAEYGREPAGTPLRSRAFSLIDKTALTSTNRKSIFSIDQISHPSPTPDLSSALLMSHSQQEGDAGPGLVGSVFQ